MACAWSLARFPDKFDVHVWEKETISGGVATSEDLRGEGDVYINDGVQGGSTSYRNVLMLHELHGFKPTNVGFRVCFGKGDLAWNNYAEDGDLSEMVQRLGPEIARFGRLLKWVTRFELIFIFVPIVKLLKWFGFSEDFRNSMVFPLVALFFGTGNTTPQVASAIIARVFLDPDLKLFDYDPERLLAQEAAMFSFPRLSDIYKTMTANMDAKFSHGRAVKLVKRHSGSVEVTDEHGVTETFSQIVLCSNADKSLAMLEQPSRMEKRCLGNVKFYDDVSVTHEDTEYMHRHYEMAKDKTSETAAKEMYYVRTAPENREKIEMSFNLSNYQPQLKGCDRNIYQTIYLNAAEDKELWTMNEVKPEKTLLTKWWHQFAHEASHYYKVVPFVRFIQNTKRTWYAGAWTLVNTHEIATISGLAVAHRLGAPYPFAHDKLAKKQFDMYLGSIHGVMSPTTKVIVYTLLLGLLVGIVFLILVYGAEVEL